MTSRIPFNKPFIVGNELRYIAEAVQQGRIAANGLFTRRCAELIEQRFGTGRVLMTPSCTAALELAAMLAQLQPGDEAIVPSFTFVSTASAIARTGARPVFVDVREDTLNLDERLLEAALTPRTKAVFAVHYAGVACQLDVLVEFTRRHGLMLVEDAAQGLNAWHRDRALGSLGQLGCYSFHETKNYICGEGGALCVNDPQLLERAEILREKGTNRNQFFRGQVDKYTWVDLGSSYLPSELACAFLFAQLERLEHITERRQAIWNYYRQRLERWEAAGRLRLPCVPPECRHNAHLFYLLLPNRAQRDALIDDLRRSGIQAVFHYVPLHSSPMGRRLSERVPQLPVTDDVSDRLVRLPLFYDLTADQQRAVADAVDRFLESQ